MEMVNCSNKKLGKVRIHTTFRAGWKGEGCVERGKSRSTLGRSSNLRYIPNFGLANDIMRPKLSMVLSMR